MTAGGLPPPRAATHGGRFLYREGPGAVCAALRLNARYCSLLSASPMLAPVSRSKVLNCFGFYHLSFSNADLEIQKCDLGHVLTMRF